MTQRRRHSFLEAVASTAVGFVISMAVWPPISVHLLHKPPAISEGLSVVGVYTVISVARGYLMRRLFNRIHTPPRGNDATCFCGRPAWGIRTSDRAMLCRYHAGVDR